MPSALLIVAGLAGLLLGADLLVRGSAALASQLGADLLVLAVVALITVPVLVSGHRMSRLEGGAFVRHTSATWPG